MSAPTAAEAVAALHSRAFEEGVRCPTCNGDGTVPGGRKLIHTRAGGIGADWDIDSAVAFVEGADEIAWTDSLLGHELAARQGDRVVCFDVRRPRETRG